MILNPVMLILVLTSVFVAALSLGAAVFIRTPLSLLAFWGFPLGGVSPWLAVFLLTFALGLLQKDPSRGQAGMMLMLFPLLGMVLFGVLFSVIGLFALQDASLASRFFWGNTLSALPALLCLALVVMAHRG